MDDVKARLDKLLELLTQRVAVLKVSKEVDEKTRELVGATEEQATEAFLTHEKVASWLSRYPPDPRTEEATMREALLPRLQAAAQEIQDRFDDPAQRPLAGAPHVRGRRKERFQQRPLGIGRVTRVAQSAPVVPSPVLQRPHPPRPPRIAPARASARRRCRDASATARTRGPVPR